jgi:hypothetical protein
VPFVRDLVPTVDLEHRIVVIQSGLVGSRLREIDDIEGGSADAH